MTLAADAAVVGSGPNGLAGAITLARAGLRVAVFEQLDRPGGGMRTDEPVLRGVRHDTCSAVHPLAFASPFFRSIDLRRRVGFVVPEVSFGHPLDGGRAGLAYRELGRTVAALGADGAPYDRVLGPLVASLDELTEVALGGVERAAAHPVSTLRLGGRVLEQATALRTLRFVGATAPALLAGAAAHANAPLPSIACAGVGLVLTAYAHALGWPLPIGGSEAIAVALAAVLVEHGGSIHCGHEIGSLAEVRALTGARIILLDVTPAALARLAGEALPDRYRQRLLRLRHGNAASKVDFVLRAPVPWLAPELSGAGTVHVGGPRAELERAARDVAAGRHPEQPYLLVVQPTPHDPSRAPVGRHVLSTYAQVPAGSERDMTDAVVARISRFAPGFRDVILASRAMTARGLGRHNPNLVGGDIGGGAITALRLLGGPVPGRRPWKTPLPGVYLCSASTPPGPGVHGMCGWHAARLALEEQRADRAPRRRKPAGERVRSALVILGVGKS